MTEIEEEQISPELRERAAQLSLKIGHLCVGEMISTVFLALIPLLASALSRIPEENQKFCIKELTKELKENLKEFNKIRATLSSECQQSE